MNKLIRFHIADTFIVIGKIKIPIHPPVSSPAVPYNPRAIGRGLMRIAKAGSRKRIIPADDTYRMVGHLLVIGIVRIDRGI